jgi:hypothetical protein
MRLSLYVCAYVGISSDNKELDNTVVIDVAQHMQTVCHHIAAAQSSLTKAISCTCHHITLH